MSSCCCCCNYLITEHISRRANHPSAPPLVQCQKPHSCLKSQMLKAKFQTHEKLGWKKPGADVLKETNWESFCQQKKKKKQMEKRGSKKKRKKKLWELHNLGREDGKKRFLNQAAICHTTFLRPIYAKTGFSENAKIFSESGLAFTWRWLFPLWPHRQKPHNWKMISRVSFKLLALCKCQSRSFWGRWCHSSKPLP